MVSSEGLVWYFFPAESIVGIFLVELVFSSQIECFYKGWAQPAPAFWRTGFGPPKAQSAQSHNVFLDGGRKPHLGAK
jgi:hypothetical protein